MFVLVIFFGTAPSSSGLGLWLLKSATRVRIPSGLQFISPNLHNEGALRIEMVMAFTQRVDLSDAQVKAISALVNGRISQNESVLDAHGRDESAFPPIRPSAVVTVHST